MTSPWLPHRLNPDPTNPYDDEHYNPDRPRISWEPEDYHQEPIPDVRWPRGQKPTNLWRGLHIDLDHPQWADHPNVQGMKRILYGEQDTGGGLYAPSPSQGNLHPHPASPEGKALSQHILDFAEDVGQNVDTYREPWTEENDATRVPFTKIHDKSDPTWLGRHWTTDPDVADSYAYKTTPGRRGLSVLMRARWDGRGEDLSRANAGGSWPDENEINLVPGTQLDIHGLGIRHPDNVHNMYNSQYHNLLKGQDHERRTARRLAMPWYHNTDAELNSGDELIPAAESGHRSRWVEDEYGPVPGYDSRNVHLYNEKADPAAYADHGKNRYEVEPLGKVGRDPEWEYNKDAHMEESEADGEEPGDESEIPGYHSYVTPRARVVRRMAGAEPFQMRIEHLDPHLVYDREREFSDDPWSGWRKRTVPLVEDVKRNGIGMPVTMATDGHLGILEDGNHRAAAAKIIGLPTVPVRFQRANTRYLSRGGGVPLHPSVQQHLADHPEALLDHVERQPSWAQGEFPGHTRPYERQAFRLTAAFDREAAVTQDLVDRLDDEFHGWVDDKSGGVQGADSGIEWGIQEGRGPIGRWRNVENFLKENYPAAHRGHQMGWEQARPLLDVSLDDPGSYNPQDDPRGWKRDEKGRVVPKTESDNLLKVYETGPEAVAKHGYDPSEIAAGMMLLHNQSHPFRGEMAQEDQDRLTSIFNKRQQMQRDYEQRTAALEFQRGDIHPDYGPDPEHAISAHLDGEPVGRMLWYPDGELTQIEVHPNHRRQGIGTQMFNWAKRNVAPHLHHSPSMTSEGRDWAASMGYAPEDYDHVATAEDAMWRVAAQDPSVLAKDYTDQLHEEFHDWAKSQPYVPVGFLAGDTNWDYTRGMGGPLSYWENVEGFLKDKYPAAHRGLKYGEEEVATTLDGKPKKDLGGYSKGYGQPYETGPEAVAKHGYDPRQVAAGMMYLHSQAHNTARLNDRKDILPRDINRLTDIFDKRQQMQRDYEQRLTQAFRLTAAFVSFPQFSLRHARLTDDLIYGLSRQFTQWANENDKVNPRDDGLPRKYQRGPVGHWPHVEDFLKENYPAAHRGLEFGFEQAQPLLDEGETSFARATGDPYETGPEAHARHGYDPKETAAAMLLLHNDTHPGRQNWRERDTNRLVDIMQKRQQMQRDYERSRQAFRLTAAFDREAMPMPLPEDITFRYHPTNESMPRFVGGVALMAPAVTAWRGRRPVGSLEWYPGGEHGGMAGGKRGEISNIHVLEGDQGQGIATGMFDHARKFVPEVHHSETLTDEGRGWREYEESRRQAFRLTAAFDVEAMPAPLPEGLTFHHKPSRYLDESEYSYMEPSLSAHLNGEQVGRIRWHDRDDLRDYAPGEVSGITVAEPHRRSGIATELFDRAKEIEPRLHHSPQRSPLGRQWIEYEESRNRQAFRLTAAFKVPA